MPPSKTDSPVSFKEKLQAIDRAGDIFIERLWLCYKKWRLDRAAKSKAYLTHCGKTLTPLEQFFKISIGVLFELMTIFLGIVFLWFNALFFFLKAESVDLSVLKPNAALWFSDTFDGQAADMDTLRVDWIKDRQALAVVAKGVSVNETDGMDLLTVPHMEVEFELASLVYGQFVMTRADIEGGAVTAIRRADGSISAGLGMPDAMGRFGPVLEPGQDVVEPETESEVAPKITQARWRFLKSLKITHGEAYIIDEIDDLNWKLDNLNLDYRFDGDRLSVISASNILSSDSLTPFTVDFKSNSDLSDFDVDVNLTGFKPADLAPKRGRFSSAKILDAPVDISAKIKASAERGLTQTDIDFKAGKGLLRTGETPTPFNAASLKAVYNVATQSLNLRDINVDAQSLRLDGNGVVTQIGSPKSGYGKKPVQLYMDLKPVYLDLGGEFQAPLEMDTLTVKGGYDIQNRKFDFSQLDLNFGDYQGGFSGDITFNDGDKILKSLNINGGVRGVVTQKILLDHWPINFAPNTREWIRDRFDYVDIPVIDFQTNLTEEILSRPGMANEDLSLTFDFQNGSVRYVDGMTALVNASGRGHLQGNRFDIRVDKGRVGDLVTANFGTVEMPVLYPRGGDMNIVVNGYGNLENVLSLIDEPPLQLMRKLELKPQDFGGTGNFEFKMTRPLVKGRFPERETYSVTGDFKEVYGPFTLGKYRLEQGDVKIDIADKELKLTGDVNLGPWRAGLEVFNSFGNSEEPTRYSLRGPVTRDTLDRFGVGLREYFDGGFDLTLDAIGNGLTISDTRITADLFESELHFTDIWTKPRGTTGSLSAVMERTPEQSTVLKNLNIQAEGLSVAGQVELASDLRLLSLNLPTVKIGGVVDGALDGSAHTASDVQLSLNGAFLNLSPWTRDAFAPTSEGLKLPITLTANIDRLILRDNFELLGANTLYVADEQGILNAKLSGSYKTGAFTADLGRAADGVGRSIQINIPDAGNALQNLYGLKNITGGKMTINAALPEAGVPGPIKGVARIEGFKLVEAPVFARLLSLASLQGLGEILSGDGMNFNEMNAPFEFEEGVLSLEDATASGSAIGLTGTGYISFADKSVGMDGVIVPSYTMNSLLGGIPLLGDIVVGKKGEGIFALNYSVKGPFEKTQISVNPLSALTPGFLRRIFQPTKQQPLKTELPSEPAEPVKQP